MGFPRQEYWSGLPFPSLGNLLAQGLNPDLLHWATREAHEKLTTGKNIYSKFLYIISLYQNMYVQYILYLDLEVQIFKSISE